jgi:DUF4097 and DUF4098 domain-containing protein YvlB
MNMKDLLRRSLPIVLLAAACLYTYKVEVPETYTYSAAGITALSAATQNGAISVTASADTIITVGVLKHAYGRDKDDAEKAIANVVYSGAVVGNELTVKAEMPSGPRPYGAAFTITARETTDLALSTTNGDITVSNTVADIGVGTTNGDVVLTGTAGNASLSTTNGKVNVSVHRGAVDGKTTNGAIDCDLAALGASEDVGIETTNGKVTLLLPADVSAVIDATTTNGTITIYDFTVTYEVQTENHLRGSIGSGASSITITTTNGDVTVRQRS